MDKENKWKGLFFQALHYAEISDDIENDDDLTNDNYNEVSYTDLVSLIDSLTEEELDYIKSNINKLHKKLNQVTKLNDAEALELRAINTLEEIINTKEETKTL